ncbi:Aldo/keto reductase [Croceitalea dokdonensis DOKDO 023]|uniref:Aldo/keto reductase n=1 Tax=Croceitalea dokdonensis DOKDO 023 TaxID=1300341 RepID=A0A0N8H4H8_9FLAO|nr:aldo/keto reductase [Croceitalea dokdonensis]KPM33412.1 Aldo/keto reductase [Croceitalea dokdonensis DOKDO 023]
MIDVRNLSKLGIGTYRMSENDPSHFSSLNYAIEKGVNLIDTASNYQFGDSERLIGKVLDSNTRQNVFIITKAGYINGADITEFSKILNTPWTIKVRDNFLYSIEPKFLRAQLTASLKRLNTSYIDGFLIHNPEHYFDVENQNQKFIYDHLLEACSFLEKMVDDGLIGYYGISSNEIPKGNIDIEKIVNKSNYLPNFRLLQFPYNLVETSASRKKDMGTSLIDFCKKNNLITFSNRPLNTTYQGKVLRLADYMDEYSKIDFRKEEVLFDDFLSRIDEQLLKYGESSKAKDFAPIKFFVENRKGIANPEAVNKAFNTYLRPFVNQLQFNSNDVQKIMSELLNYWQLYSKKSISERSKGLMDSLKLKGEIDQNDKRNISLISCENYLNQGINHVLVGMRKKIYIDNLSPLL